MPQFRAQGHDGPRNGFAGNEFPDEVECREVKVAGEPGFEPGLTESESVGLPLTYSPTGAFGERRGKTFGCIKRNPAARQAVVVSAAF